MRVAKEMATIRRDTTCTRACTPNQLKSWILHEHTIRTWPFSSSIFACWSAPPAGDRMGAAPVDRGWYDVGFVLAGAACLTGAVYGENAGTNKTATVNKQERLGLSAYWLNCEQKPRVSFQWLYRWASVWRAMSGSWVHREISPILRATFLF